MLNADIAERVGVASHGEPVAGPQRRRRPGQASLVDEDRPGSPQTIDQRQIVPPDINHVRMGLVCRPIRATRRHDGTAEVSNGDTASWFTCATWGTALITSRAWIKEDDDDHQG
jgi:hypothetical protein